MMRTGPYSLNQPLPADVAAGNPGWWLSYRRFPVFSTPWVVRRALLMGLFIVAWGAISSIFHYAQGLPASEATQLFFWFLLAFGTIVNAGPLLAAGVRHRRWPIRRERIGVVVAMVAGLCLALAADAWSSAHIATLIGQSIEREMGGPALALNLLVLLFIYLLLGGGLALRAYFSEARRVSEFDRGLAMQQLAADKLHADQSLALLQAQIEPHFLFNTLATIRSELRRAPEQAEQTLDALCDYLRATIPRLRESEAGQLSTLGEQIDIAHHYLRVMQGRLGTRLTFSIDVEAGLADQPFPPFLLLSLVENAIEHGVEPSPNGGAIDVAASREAQLVVICIRNTGTGLSESPGQGVGLSNVRQQLALRYGDRARFRLGTGPDGSVEARIEIPLEQGS